VFVGFYLQQQHFHCRRHLHRQLLLHNRQQQKQQSLHVLQKMEVGKFQSDFKRFDANCIQIHFIHLVEIKLSS
jgi:hypothetical protein